MKNTTTTPQTDPRGRQLGSRTDLFYWFSSTEEARDYANDHDGRLVYAEWRNGEHFPKTSTYCVLGEDCPKRGMAMSRIAKEGDSTAIYGSISEVNNSVTPFYEDEGLPLPAYIASLLKVIDWSQSVLAINESDNWAEIRDRYTTVYEHDQKYLAIAVELNV
jgi:hypothetical protein